VIQALIFDFDGTILDTETAALESWRSVYAGFGHDLSLELWKDAVGRTPGQGFDAMAHLHALVGETLDREDVLADRLARKYALCEPLLLQPGIQDILREAADRNMPCAVASSSDREWVEGWLARHAIRDAFRCVRTADDVVHAKPAPDLFLSAAACLGVQPANCLVFEDSPNGVLAASAAGMTCVAVPCAITAQVPMPPVDLLLSSLADMTLDEILRHVVALQPDK
jgi:HAD superfamily hydrolase (TIGR01509 family)